MSTFRWLFFSRYQNTGTRTAGPDFCSCGNSACSERPRGWKTPGSSELRNPSFSYLEQDIDREIYLKKKAELILEKKSLEEKIHTLEQRQTAWVEPMQNWIKSAQTVGITAGANNLFEKKVVAKEIFGPNILLTTRNIRLKPTVSEGGKCIPPLPIVGEKSFDTAEIVSEIGGKNTMSFQTNGGKNPWDTLRFARELFTQNQNKNTPQFSESVIVVARRGIEPLFSP